MKKIFKNISLKKIASILSMLVFTVQSVFAFNLPAGSRSGSHIKVEINDIYLTDSDMLNVEMSINTLPADMKGNAETVYTPMFVNGNDTLFLKPFSVVGRNRYFYAIRNNETQQLMFYKDKGYQYNPDGTETILSLPYQMTLSVPYRPWLESATFEIKTEYVGCSSCPVKGSEGWNDYYPIAQNDFVTRTFTPELVYVTPVAEAVKTREIAARAYIDFPVNKVEIYPDYRRNPLELAKIRATIDSIRNDKDITVTSLHISGTASPEGSYENNVRLAKGRTEALKNYVQNLYKFPAGFITTSFEPVDWAGLREFLMNGPVGPAYASISHVNLDEVLPSRENILNIVNGNVEPYQKNQNIKNNYPKEYQWLLQNVYPALRHSDYRIEFEIRTYTEAAEILEIMNSQPQKLSLAELFVAANSLPEGSDEYKEAFEIAVRMFPNDETANLNAAVSAIKRGELGVAGKYLENAGNSPEAQYTGAILLYLQNDAESAISLLQQVATSDSEVAVKAENAVKSINFLNENNDKKFKLFQ